MGASKKFGFFLANDIFIGVSYTNSMFKYTNNKLFNIFLIVI